ncbi:MAG TPA: phosphoketolase, partial [Clostridia bacterium]|nr:phosphoketolase [Clostridia bacterium]
MNEMKESANFQVEDTELQKIHSYWNACNYLAAGMIYLKDNALLRKPLETEHIKNRLLGHWGTSPGLSFIYVHLNRLIKKYHLNMIFVTGPGHGAPGFLAPAYLEGTYSEIYPDKSEDEEGLTKFFKQFSFPGHLGRLTSPDNRASSCIC